MYFLIGIWGGQRRVYAAIKFFLYTMVGLAADAGRHPRRSTSCTARRRAPAPSTLPRCSTRYVLLAGRRRTWLFLAFALAFAIKVPMFPFHTWLPDAHVEAPTAGSVILAGVLLKMGTYGFLRFACRSSRTRRCAFAPLMLALAVIGIIYGALVALVQPDMKKLVAYSSVSHLGFVMLGIFALNPQGMVGRDPPDGQPRPLDRRALPARRHALRAAPHAADRRLRRPVERRCRRFAALFLIVTLLVDRPARA